MKIVAKILLGLAVLSLIPVKFCGGTAPLGLVLLGLGIASGGFLLVLVIPLFYAVGAVVIWFFKGPGRLSGDKKFSARKMSGGSEEVEPFSQALVHYVRNARRHGSDDETIRATCRRQGASRAEIEKAFELTGDAGAKN